MIGTYLLDIRTLADPLLNGKIDSRIRSVLPRERIEKILGQKQPALRKQHLGAGILLHYAMEQAGCGHSVISYNHYGKPEVPGCPCNLSHSGDYVIMSMQERDKQQKAQDSHHSKELLIGCDIERIKTYRPGVARRFFTKTEYEKLESIKEQKTQAELFCQYWTRKESVLKLTGLGISLPMDSFDVSEGSQPAADLQKTEAWYQSAKEKKEPEIERAFRILRDRTLYFEEYRYEDYYITVCSTQKEFCFHKQ